MPALLQALDGELLGDGCLCVGKRYSNACFRLQAKARGQVLLAHAVLHSLGGDLHSFVRKSSGYRTTPTVMWQWASHRSEFLTNLWKKWYRHGRKIVPPGFTLTSTSALHWYVGDGSLHKSQAQIVFCTDNFDRLSIQRLVKQLQDRGFHPSLRHTKKGHVRIALTGACVDLFLRWIGPCPVSEMEHKWALVSRKYATKRITEEEKTTIRRLRAEGCSYRQISSYIGRNIGTVHAVVNGRQRRA